MLNTHRKPFSTSSAFHKLHDKLPQPCVLTEQKRIFVLKEKGTFLPLPRPRPPRPLPLVLAARPLPAAGFFAGCSSVIAGAVCCFASSSGSCFKAFGSGLEVLTCNESLLRLDQACQAANFVTLILDSLHLRQRPLLMWKLQSCDSLYLKKKLPATKEAMRLIEIVRADHRELAWSSPCPSGFSFALAELNAASAAVSVAAIFFFLSGPSSSEGFPPWPSSVIARFRFESSRRLLEASLHALKNI